MGVAEIYKQVAKEGKMREMLQVETGDDFKKIELQGKPKKETAAATEEGEKDTNTVITSDMVEKVPDNDDLESWISNSKKKLFDAVKVVRDNLKPMSSMTPCYSPMCLAGDPTQCYSSTCTLKQDREGLVGAAEIYKQVAKEGTGVSDVQVRQAHIQFYVLDIFIAFYKPFTNCNNL